MEINVHVAGQGRFIVNDSIVVYDIDAGEEGMNYSVYWDEEKCTETEAMEIAEAFMKKTLIGIMNEQTN